MTRLIAVWQEVKVRRDRSHAFWTSTSSYLGCLRAEPLGQNLGLAAVLV